ncbi:Arf GTPase activating protein [Dillenia turbinata]|uniref:Arf GTPase activating protein n=1 Tax=Dillenia turbinata TaxID=194707 RepID=A0AAN8Z5C5_9MAGN
MFISNPKMIKVTFEVRSTTLDTWLPEQVAFMQSVGNERSNSYWEARLPPNVDRSQIKKFIRSKQLVIESPSTLLFHFLVVWDIRHMERRWVSKKSAHTIPKPIEKCNRPNNLVDGVAKRNLRKKTRTHSLDEGMLNNYTARVAPQPTARPHWVTPSFSELAFFHLHFTATYVSAIPSGNSSKAKPAAPSKQTGVAVDLYDLLYVQELKLNHSSLPPSSWATFDCKIASLFA